MEDDIDLYARGLSKRLGRYAREYALKRARELKLCGDTAGQSVWLRVAAHVVEQPADRPHTI